MIDRSRNDHDVTSGLNIIQAAANLTLIHDLDRMADAAAELASDLYAAYGQADADHGTICRLGEQLAQERALSAARLAAIHQQARRHAVQLREARAARRVSLVGWLWGAR